MMQFKPRYQPKTKRPLWRDYVTVCIAAISHPYIVTATDMKVSTGMYSSDFASLKTVWLRGKWSAMLSGKISQKPPLIDYIQESLKQVPKPSFTQMVKACKEAYIEYARQLATEKVLRPFNLTLDTFLKSRKDIGEAQYERLWNDFSRVQVGFDLLVFGFDTDDTPRVFVVSTPTEDNPSFITYCDDIGFAAIGSGLYLAESVLHGFEQSYTTELEDTIYHVACAKFAAESATDVGRLTYMRIHQCEGGALNPHLSWVEKGLRSEWENYGRPHFRPEARQAITQELGKMRQHKAQKDASASALQVIEPTI